MILPIVLNWCVWQGFSRRTLYWRLWRSLVMCYFVSFEHVVGRGYQMSAEDIERNMQEACVDSIRS